MTKREDEAIKGDIIRGLSENPSVSADSILVSVNAGHVRLQGTLYTLAGKVQAADIAKHVPGVVAVQNDLTVSADQPTSDQELTQTARNRLDESGLANIGVRVNAGNAYLMGVVRNISAIKQAMGVAESVSGVRGIYSELTIAAGEPVDNLKLADDVIEAISDDPSIDSMDLHVRADDGFVVISGSAGDRDQIALATQIAESVPGVRKVENLMNIRGFIPK